MSNLIKYSCGVDMASKKFDVCLISMDDTLTTKIKGTKKFDNSSSGIRDFCKWLKNKCSAMNIPLFVMVEATGVYHEQMAYKLSSEGFKINVVLPNKSKKYMESLGLKSKNDKIDAYGLALMCAQQKHEEFKPLDPLFYELRSITRFYQSTQEAITALTNQLHALEHGFHSSKKLIVEIKRTVFTKKKMLKRLLEEMHKLVDQRQEVKEKIERIEQVKGLGFLTITTIVAETAGFENFDNIPGLVSYAGFDVIENQSGLHVGKTKISKKGNSRIRRALHLPSFVIVKYDAGFKLFYDRIFEKSFIPLKAYIAVQKKMLVLIYTLWKNDQKYDPEMYFNRLKEKSSTDKTVLHKVEN